MLFELGVGEEAEVVVVVAEEEVGAGGSSVVAVGKCGCRYC